MGAYPTRGLKAGYRGRNVQCQKLRIQGSRERQRGAKALLAERGESKFIADPSQQFTSMGVGLR